MTNLTADEARKLQVCRICKSPLQHCTGDEPKNWWKLFYEMTFPNRIVLNFGKEYAHPECVDAAIAKGAGK